MSSVSLHRTGRVLRVTLERAHRGNSVGDALFGDLLRAVTAADADDDVRAIVVTGAGRNFCVGADRAVLDQLAGAGRINLLEAGLDGFGGDVGLPVYSDLQRRSDGIGMGRWIARWLEVDTPTVAALNGGVAGGGFAVALLHDVRIAARNARLAPSLVALGLAPEMGMSWLLPRLVGHSRAFDLLTRSRPIDADEALALGLVEQVVEPSELVEAAEARAAELAAQPPLAIRTVKRLLRGSWNTTLDQQLEREWAAAVALFGDRDTPDRLQQIARGMAGPG